MYLVIGVLVASNVLLVFVLNLMNMNINARMTTLESRMIALEATMTARFDLLMGRMT